MKIGVISDVHGNIRALEKCLHFLRQQKTDRLIFLGDAVGYLPFGVEVLELLQQNGIECILGNHEAMLLGILPLPEKNEEVYKLGRIKKKMSDTLLQFVGSWKQHIELQVDDLQFFFVHGSANDHLTGYVYPDTDLSAFKHVKYNVVVMGHTHYPFLRKEYDKVFINAGSVGLPRDSGNLSSLVVIDTIPFKAVHYRLRNDTEFILSEMKGEVHESATERLRRNNDANVLGIMVNN